VLANRVKETATTTGAGNFTVGLGTLILKLIGANGDDDE
jgi:hypothetical protein